MKSNFRIPLLLVVVSQLSMAILCEREDDGPILSRNATKVTLSEGPEFSVGDTLWISGKVSSMLANATTSDSVPNTNEFVRDVISVMQLRTAEHRSNTLEAVDAFEMVATIGNFDFLGVCPASELVAIAPLNENGQEYVYSIGLISKHPGDFVLSWLEPVDFQNDNLNTQLLERYPVSGRNNYLGLMKCGIIYTVANVNQRRSDFFFSVD